MKFDDRIQHGTDWTGQDLSGWLISEKFDGCRAFWDGENMWTRQGKVIDLPDTWRVALPAGMLLDGELFSPLGLSFASNAARYGQRHFHSGMAFIVFDAPSMAGHWLNRLDAARAALAGCAIAQVVEAWIARDSAQVVVAMKAVQKRGGEGLMARHPDIGTQPGRTQKLLKVKKTCPVKKSARRTAIETAMTFSVAL